MELADDGIQAADRDAARDRRRDRSSTRQSDMTARSIATTNPGKIREIQGILDGVPVELRDAGGLSRHRRARGDRRDVRRERAAQGALLLAATPGCLRSPTTRASRSRRSAALPGVHSARWDGDDYADQVRGDYRELAARRARRRAPARFVAHVALAHDGRILFEPTGIVEGEIAPEPRGRTASATTRSSSTRRTAARWPRSPVMKKPQSATAGRRSPRCVNS